MWKKIGIPGKIAAITTGRVARIGFPIIAPAIDSIIAPMRGNFNSFMLSGKIAGRIVLFICTLFLYIKFFFLV